MTCQAFHRLTNAEHGTLNAALTSYVDEIEDPSEAFAVRDLAKTIISSDVYLIIRCSEDFGDRL